MKYKIDRSAQFIDCNICGEVKPFTNEYFEFRKDRGLLTRRCKTCLVKKSIEYRDNNIDKVNEYRRKYYSLNKYKINAQCIKSYKKHRTKRLESMKISYQNNIENRKKSSRNYYSQNREMALGMQKKWR